MPYQDYCLPYQLSLTIMVHYELHFAAAFETHKFWSHWTKCLWSLAWNLPIFHVGHLHRTFASSTHVATPRIILLWRGGLSAQALGPRPQSYPAGRPDWPMELPTCGRPRADYRGAQARATWPVHDIQPLPRVWQTDQPLWLVTGECSIHIHFLIPLALVLVYLLCCAIPWCGCVHSVCACLMCVIVICGCGPAGCHERRGGREWEEINWHGPSVSL